MRWESPSCYRPLASGTRAGNQGGRQSAATSSCGASWPSSGSSTGERPRPGSKDQSNLWRCPGKASSFPPAWMYSSKALKASRCSRSRKLFCPSGGFHLDLVWAIRFRRTPGKDRSPAGPGPQGGGRWGVGFAMGVRYGEVCRDLSPTWEIWNHTKEIFLQAQ